MTESRVIPTSRGVLALGDDREATLALGRELATGGLATSVVVHLADPGQERRFVSAIRARGPAEPLAERLASVGTWGVWETEFRHVLDHGRRFPDGEPSQGVAMLFGVWRNPGMTPAEFDAHWRDRHAPLAVEHHVGMWDYTQCSFRGARGPCKVDYDGVAICQFPSMEDLERRFFGGPESERIIGEDAATFGDPGRLDRVRMNEIVLGREG